MEEALALAKEAAACGEVPVGAVVVYRDQVIGRGRNRRESAQTALAHAELEAIHQACQYMGSWRLRGCILYVTLEPCPMCAGAIANAQIDTVVYGLDDPQAGCAGTAANVFALPYVHAPEVYRGLCEGECRALLRGFFQGLRGKGRDGRPSGGCLNKKR